VLGASCCKEAEAHNKLCLNKIWQFFTRSVGCYILPQHCEKHLKSYACLSVCVCLYNTTHSSVCSSGSRLISVTGSNKLSGSPMIPSLTTSATRCYTVLVASGRTAALCPLQIRLRTSTAGKSGHAQVPGITPKSAPSIATVPLQIGVFADDADDHDQLTSRILTVGKFGHAQVPSKVPVPVEVPGSRRFLVPHEYTSQMACRSVHPVLHSSRSRTTDTPQRPRYTHNNSTRPVLCIITTINDILTVRAWTEHKHSLVYQCPSSSILT